MAFERLRKFGRWAKDTKDARKPKGILSDLKKEAEHTIELVEPVLELLPNDTSTELEKDISNLKVLAGQLETAKTTYKESRESLRDEKSNADQKVIDEKKADKQQKKEQKKREKEERKKKNEEEEKNKDLLEKLQKEVEDAEKAITKELKEFENIQHIEQIDYKVNDRIKTQVETISHVSKEVQDIVDEYHQIIAEDITDERRKKQENVLDRLSKRIKEAKKDIKNAFSVISGEIDIEEKVGKKEVRWLKRVVYDDREAMAAVKKAQEVMGGVDTFVQENPEILDPEIVTTAHVATEELGSFFTEVIGRRFLGLIGTKMKERKEKEDELKEVIKNALKDKDLFTNKVFHNKMPPILNKIEQLNQQIEDIDEDLIRMIQTVVGGYGGRGSLIKIREELIELEEHLGDLIKHIKSKRGRWRRFKHFMTKNRQL
jgi:DNA repair exonuclease SbcCD ATPase subunit